MSFTRTCVECGATIEYKSEKSQRRAEKRQALCQSCAAKRRWADPEQRRLWTAGIRKHCQTEEHRKKLSEAMKRATQDEEHRRVMSERMKNVCQDSDYRKLMSERMTRVCLDPAYRKLQSARLKAAWQDPDCSYNQPEFREKQSEAQKKRMLADFEDCGEQEAQNLCARSTWSRQVRERDEWVCQECGTTENLHAHHIKPKFAYPELANDLDNGITLCRECHVQKHPWMKNLFESSCNDESEMV